MPRGLSWGPIAFSTFSNPHMTHSNPEIQTWKVRGEDMNVSALTSPVGKARGKTRAQRCPCLPIPAHPLGEALRMSHLRGQPPHLPSDPMKGRGRDPQRSDKPEVTQQAGQCQLFPQSFPPKDSVAWWGALPAGPAAPAPAVTPASAFTGPGNPHHQQLPALRVPGGHPGENPIPFQPPTP